MKKPIVFISHITEEKEIALALKGLVERTFLSMIDVFVASDPTSIKLGQKWLDEITYALKSCSIEIILSSPESVKRPWINFEGGSGWIRGIPVIPLCHSGMIPAKLPQPLGTLQAAIATEETGLKLVFPVLAEAIGCTLPDVDYSQFISDVKQYEKITHDIQEFKEKVPVSEFSGLTPHEQDTLVAIAEESAIPGGNTDINRVNLAMEKKGYRGIAVALALKMLSRKNLIETTTDRDWNGNDTPVATVSEEGWIWLEANHSLIPLRNQVKHMAKHEQDESGEIPF